MEKTGSLDISEENKQSGDFVVKENEEKTKNLPVKKDSQFVKFTSWLRASATVEKGDKRKTMEDRVMIGHFEHREKQYYLFLVLDGHGGSEVADYTKDHFMEIFGHFVIRTRGHKIRTVINNTFVELNRRVSQYTSGTTASLLLLIDRKLNKKHLEIWVANVGDSTMYGVKQRSDHKDLVRKLSTDHNLHYKSEQLRISQVPEYEIQDGYIVVSSTGAAINMTRAIGDPDFGPHILPTPTIKQIKTPYSVFLIASDGLWDYVNSKQLWQRLNNPKDRRAWRDSAYRLNRWRNDNFPQHDNSSLIIVYIDHDEYENKDGKDIQRSKTKKELETNATGETSEFLKIDPKTQVVIKDHIEENLNETLENLKV